MSKFKTALTLLLFTLHFTLFTSSVHASWSIDLDPPTTTISPSCISCSAGSTSTITITCSDTGGSGCNRVEYSEGGSSGPWTTYSGSLSRTSNTTIYARSFDNAGNISSVVSQLITFSASPPNCNFTGPVSLNVGVQGTFTQSNTANTTSWSWTSVPAGGTFIAPFASSSNWSASSANTYTITLTVSGPGGSATCDNFSTGGTVVSNNPDLIVDTLSSTPASPVVGNLMSFSGRVFNQGGSNAVASLTRLRIDIGNDGTWDVNPANVSTPSLNATVGSTASWSNVWTATAGTHKYEICADIGGAVGESNEGNNCSTATFTVTGPPNCNFTGPVSLNVGVQGTFTQSNTANTTSWSWTSVPAGGTFIAPFASSSNWSASSANTYTLRLDCSGPGGFSSATTIVTVTAPTPTPIGGGGGSPTPTPPGGATPTPTGAATPTPTTVPVPTVDLLADGSLAGFGGSMNITNSSSHTLSWTTTNSTSCTASNAWSGAKPTSGSQSTGILTSPPSTFTYRLDCSGPGGTNFDTVTLTINSSLPWIQTTGGDVHSNTGINTPGGP